MGFIVLRVLSITTWLPTNILYTRWTTHLCILYQVCDARGAASAVAFVIKKKTKKTIYP